MSGAQFSDRDPRLSDQVPVTNTSARCVVSFLMSANSNNILGLETPPTSRRVYPSHEYSKYHAQPLYRESPLMHLATEGPSSQTADKSPGWVLRMIGIPAPSQEYLDAVIHLKAARIVHRPYVRPTHGEGGNF